MPNLNRQILAKGWTSTIYIIPLSRKVVKVPDQKNAEEHFEVERAAYVRMSQHESAPESILKFYGVDSVMPLGLTLELAEKGCMWDYLWGCRRLEETAPDSSILLRWALQVTEALAFVHSCDILHCDIHVANFFLDQHLNLKLGDFGAASIAGDSPLLAYRATHQLWIEEQEGKWHKDISIASEVFALGAAMYNMETRRDHLEELDDEKDGDEIRRRMRARVPPSMDDVKVLGPYIEKCWKLDYRSMANILSHLKQNAAQGQLDIVDTNSNQDPVTEGCL